MLAWAVLLLIQGLLPLPLVFLTKSLVDSLVAAVAARGAWPTVQPLIGLIAVMGGVVVLAQVVQIASEWVRTAQAGLIQDYISGLIHRQSVAVDLAFYESAEFYDRLDRARSEAPARSLALLESFGGMAQSAITLVAMAAVLLPYGAWLPLVLLVSTAPALYVVVRYNQRYHHWWDRTTADRRWTQYYDVMLTQASSAAEVRLFGLGSHFHSAYQDLRRRLRGDYLRFTRSQSLARVGAAALASLFAAGALVWMGWRALQGQVTLGDLVLFYQAFDRGQNLMRSLLSSAGQIYGNSLFLQDLFTFLDMGPDVADPPAPQVAPHLLQRGVDFQGVTFRYPGSDRLALEDFSLTLPAGQLTAIVGPNGAGKSTLIKLLCRFYDPLAGRVTFDGIDLRDLALADIWRSVTVLFQSPVQYHATARQNIAVGDLEARADEAAIEAAGRAAGAHAVVERLPRGYGTLLGKLFADGTELSGGEWQRVALARAFLRQAPIIALDEPTSAMDSWAEAEWLDRFRRLVQGWTALIVTHRFTTAMRADVIHAMEGGRIVETGSHDELLARGGLYAESWTAQMRARGETAAVEPQPTW
jgi:ATP-binding cassette subfamily B protein